MSKEFLEQCELVVQNIDSSFDVKNVITAQASLPSKRNKSKLKPTIFYIHGVNGSFFEIAQVGQNSYKVIKNTENSTEVCGYYFIFESCFVPARVI